MGVLANLAADHSYGPQCYSERGCAAILRQVSSFIDARRFNPDNPAYFPRLIQSVVWRCPSSNDYGQSIV
jgi:hypothetical protein